VFSEITPAGELADPVPSLIDLGRTISAILTLFALTSCADPKVWAAECRSPDRVWTVSAYSVEHGGFGTAGVETILELKRADNSCSPGRVLAFAEGGPEIKLRMQWDNAAHLSVTYDADPEILYYQVVKACGIDITVRNSFTGHPQAKPPISARP